MSAGCALGHLPDGRLPAASKHAARKAAPEEKYAEAFSPKESEELWAVPRHKALRMKNLVSTRFFILGSSVH